MGARVSQAPLRTPYVRRPSFSFGPGEVVVPAFRRFLLPSLIAVTSVGLLAALRTAPQRARRETRVDAAIINHAIESFEKGRETFRFDTFGDEAFWGDTLKLHQAIEGAANGGVGPGLSPSGALAAGLKVDVDALPGALQSDLKHGKVDL